MSKFHGSPCKTCGETERWVSNNSCIACCRQRDRDRYAAGHRKPVNKRGWKDWYLKRNYGLTVEQYDFMLAAQGGVCAICARPPDDRKALCVDHDHATGAVRALLCDTCNTTLGKFEDDVPRFLAAAAYLERFSEPAAPRD